MNSVGALASNPRFNFRNQTDGAAHVVVRVRSRSTNGALMKQGDSRKQARRSRPQAGQRRQDSGKTKTAKISPQDVFRKEPHPGKQLAAEPGSRKISAGYVRKSIAVPSGIGTRGVYYLELFVVSGSMTITTHIFHGEGKQHGRGVKK
jgi:hypothetical protein